MKRSPQNPIITQNDIPIVKPHLVDVSSVFNPGAVKFDNKYLLLLRVQNRGRETFLMTAVSDDAVHFEINCSPVRFKGLENLKEKVYHIYDPRITRINDTYYIMFALDFDKVCKLGLGKTTDFKEFQFLGVVSDNDNRNGVLFPEKINGKYIRLDRPNLVQLKGRPRSGSAIILSESDDLIIWREVQTVLEGRYHYWDENIGAGPPPIKTSQGWLLVYHGIATHFGSNNIYQAGIALLDLENPEKVISRGRYNILEPREMYELTGQVPNVVFPSGMIVDDYDENGFADLNSKIYLYYGAADTTVCLATTTVSELINHCYAGNE